MFFFSSRRRHTRSLCDWSSDVCSSDLAIGVAFIVLMYAAFAIEARGPALAFGWINDLAVLQIGRASCRERGWISGEAVCLKKKRLHLRSSCTALSWSVMLRYLESCSVA